MLWFLLTVVALSVVGFIWTSKENTDFDSSQDLETPETENKTQTL